MIHEDGCTRIHDSGVCSGPPTPAQVAEVEARYGMTMDELADEAERGYDVDQLLPRSQRRRDALERLVEESSLPEFPDYEAIDAFLTGTYQAHWSERGFAL